MIYPKLSETYKEMIDNDVATLISDAHKYAEFIINNSKDIILKGAEILKKKKILKIDELYNIINVTDLEIINLQYQYY